MAQSRVFGRTIIPVFSYRCARWPWSKTAARRVNRTQMLMCGRMLAIRRDPAEPVSEFCNRRDIRAGKLADKMGRLSRLWADRVLRWSDHLVRPRNDASWASQAFSIQRADWLMTQRAPYVCNSRSLIAGATGTRALACAPKLRYEDSLDEALAHLME